MKKLNLLFTVALLLLGSSMLFSQAAADKLYLALASTGRVYDITTQPNPGSPTTASALPGFVNTPIPGAIANAGNLAVGYDVPGGNASNLVFIQSSLTANSALYKNGSAITPAATLPNVDIGGLATNNVPGAYLGNVYGFQRDTKVLYPIYPSGTPITVTGDNEWQNGATLGTDTFFDYQNNIYMFVNFPATNPTARYLYKITPAGVASKASPAITGVAGVALASIQGMAYLQGSVYVATVTDAPQVVTIRKINMFDGTSSVYATYTGGGFQNIDLGSVPYYVPFTLTCGGITQSSTTVPFIEKVPSNGVRSLNIPVTNVYGPGTYTINVIGANFNSSSTVNITASTTSITVPLVYDGGGSSGTRTLSVNLNGSTTACSVNVVVEKDTDSDTIPDYQDLDSDNDGILDIFECPQSVVDVTFNVADGNTQTFSAPAADLGFIFDVFTLDNSFTLTVNGTSISTSELQFQPDQTDNVRFVDGSRYGNGSVPQIYSMTGTAANPLVRIIIHKNGAISMYGSKASGGPLFPLQLYNGNNLGTVIWNQTGANSVVVSQLVVGATYISGRGNGVKNGFCDPDNDTISNQFDVDSDGDGCPDAIEGSETVRYDQVHSMTLPVGDANYIYRGQIKKIYDGVTNGTPTGIVSTTPSSNGVPQLVNYAGFNLNTTTNPSNLAGIADNTDGTSDIGQGIGTSQNGSVTDAECTRCFRPATTAGTTLVTNHGITALARAGSTTTDWPGKIKGAYTALDAKTKGFVINRVPTSALASITGVVGMIVYDTTVNCLKMYDGTGWNCYSKQTCDDFNQ